MQNLSDWIGCARHAVPLVMIDAQTLMDDHGRAAFWAARDRLKGRVDRLGRSPEHWAAVADVIADCQGMFGRA